MTRITEAFAKLRNINEKALITYITAGDPCLDMTEKLIYSIESAGADIIELGIPFSDPLADGPTIQRSTHRALMNGVKIADILQMVRKVREKCTVPLVFLVYYSSIYRYGVKRFLEECRDSGVDGLVVPDLPPEESEEYKSLADHFGLDTIYLVAPISSDDRIEIIADYSQGFIYCVSVTGTTGARNSMPGDLERFIMRVRAKTSKPIAVGFGIARPEHAADIARFADGIIVGSALVEQLEEAATNQERLAVAHSFVENLRVAMDSER